MDLERLLPTTTDDWVFLVLLVMGLCGFGVACLIWERRGYIAPAMPKPAFQNDPRSQALPPGHFVRPRAASPLVLLVTRPEDILPALSQGKPVLIDIPAFQWRLSILARAQKWGGSLGRWLISLLLGWMLTNWLDANLPDKNHPVPDWAKFNFQRQPDNKVIITPIEE